MKNPRTRAYTPEELERLLTEEVNSSEVRPTPAPPMAAPPPVVILQNNAPAVFPVPEMASTAPAPSAQTNPKITHPYTLYVVVGVILLSVGVYLYYEQRKRKEKERLKKPF